MATPRERAFFAQPFAYAGGRVIASPFQFATTGEDNLRVVSANSLSGVRLAIQGRRLNEHGEIEAFAFTHTPNTDRSTKATLHLLGSGALLNVAVFAEAGTPQIGQTFVMLQVVRGFAGPIVLLGTLLQGYVTSAQTLAWPGSPIENSLQAQPVARAITGTQPGAGGDALETVPTGARWNLLLVSVPFTLSATAGNRQPFCKLMNSSAQTISFIYYPHQYSGGQAGTVHFAANSPMYLDNGDQTTVFLPYPAILSAGYQVEIGLINGKVDDQVGVPRLLVQEALEAQ